MILYSILIKMVQTKKIQIEIKQEGIEQGNKEEEPNAYRSRPEKNN